MTTNVDITNRALAQIGARSKIVSMTDGSPEALYANLLYNPLRDFMLTEGDYDFSMTEAALNVAAAPGTVWAFTYSYPSGALRIRSLVPAVYDPLDPLPVAYSILGTGNARTINTDQSASFVIYTFAPLEDIWDPIFTEAFTRLLGSALAFALENRIEASREKLSEALNFAGIANLRDP